MSERAKALREVIGESCGRWYQDGGHRSDVAHAICEHLGLSWEDVERLDDAALDLSGKGLGGIRRAGHIDSVRDAIATLLEAAGIER